MNILAIDPGRATSGFIELRDGAIVAIEAKIPNKDLKDFVRAGGHFADGNSHLAIEMFAGYGMTAGADVFETCVWIGRLAETWLYQTAREPSLIYRKDIKLHLCGHTSAKDGDVRQALLDRLGPQGTKRSPGPTYGVSSHAWSALAVAIYYHDLLEGKIGTNRTDRSHGRMEPQSS